ncbi:MAG: K+/H+ antiporter subunit F [Burkholderiales bacterium]|nr:K+/H+ antiporter subunit F [Burkholderiales bacterium]OJX00594.1 MAG: K+/H+ antiporter subunit F [Burkholderiales bacterium 70-64]
MTQLLMWTMGFTLACLGAAAVFAAVRLFLGPGAQDRVLALDCLYMCAMLIVLVLGMRFGHAVYFEIALLIALVGFVGSVAMARFLLRGEVIE